MDRDKQIIELISGNLDKGETEKLLQKIKLDAGLKEEYERVKNVWALSMYNNKLDQLSIEKSFVDFRNRIRNSGMRHILTVLKYAATVLAIFSLGIVSRQYVFPDMNLQNPDDLNEVYVPNGKRANLTLADGSKVWLNSGTTFRFPRSFNGKVRAVNISGEAFFEVCKGKVPFIVSSEYGNIKVLGTKFNVRAYDNLQFQTTLTEGKIQFYNSLGKTFIQPNQQLRISDRGDFIIGKVDCQKISSWTEGVITFAGEPLFEVFKRLERHYNITINAEASLTSIRFTGQIIDETIEEIMVLIDQTKPITYNYDRKLRILTISEKN